MPAKQLKMGLQVFFEMTTQRNGFGQNSADQQACVFGSCECNKHSVLKIFMINGLNLKNCVICKLLSNEETKHKLFLYDFARAI